MTSPDLSAALARPGVADAFEAVVSLMVDAAARDDPATMRGAGYAFGHLVQLVDVPGSRDRLLALVRDAAVEAAMVAGGAKPAG
jgi:hypothetical protein